MKFISTTKARKQLGKLVESVSRDRTPVGLGRRDKVEVILMKYPEHINPDLDPWTQFVANSGSFDFWIDDPEIYSLDDIKEHYA